MADRMWVTSDMPHSIPPAVTNRNPRAADDQGIVCRSIVVQDRAEAATLREQRVAAVAEQVQVEGLVGLLLAVALDFDRDRLGRLAGGEGQRAGRGEGGRAWFDLPLTHHTLAV